MDFDNLVLDVGCGHIGRGNVNIDLHIEPTRHRNTIDVDLPLDVKTIPNFIVASAEYLPFKENVFKEVVSSWVLEHCNGYKMFRECVRVAKDLIHIKAGNQISCAKRLFTKDNPLHSFPVNKTWFFGMARKYRLRVIENEYCGYYEYPHFIIPLIRIPCEISFLARKTDVTITKV